MCLMGRNDLEGLQKRQGILEMWPSSSRLVTLYPNVSALDIFKRIPGRWGLAEIESNFLGRGLGVGGSESKGQPRWVGG